MMKECVKNWLTEQFGDADDVITEVWNEYIGTTTDRIAEARAALAAADFPQLDAIAHKLKGNALMVGDQPSATAAIELRDAAKASAADAAAKAIDALAALDAENRA